MSRSTIAVQNLYLPSQATTSRIGSGDKWITDSPGSSSSRIRTLHPSGLGARCEDAVHG